MQKISFGSWAFALGPYADHPVPFEPLVRRLAELGYEAVEIWGVKHHVTLESFPTPESRAALRELLAELNLECSGYACDQGGLDPADPKQAQLYLEQLARNVEMCRDLGTKNLRIDSGVAPNPRLDDAGRAQALQYAAELWQQAAELASQGEVRLLWELEPGLQFNRPSEVAALFDKVEHPSFQILFDTTHAYCCCVANAGRELPEVLAGGVEELLDALSPRIGGIHLADADGEVDASGAGVHAPFTVGRIDCKALAPKLAALSGVDYITLDMAGWPGAWDLLEAQLAYAKRLVA
ncbi:MAG: TIM barrel protein [Acidobacteria bacterium]|nr:TIM barrel protein [Acidobacteriota bacterium]